MLSTIVQCSVLGCQRRLLTSKCWSLKLLRLQSSSRSLIWVLLACHFNVNWVLGIADSKKRLSRGAGQKKASSRHIANEGAGTGPARLADQFWRAMRKVVPPLHGFSSRTAGRTIWDTYSVYNKGVYHSIQLLSHSLVMPNMPEGLLILAPSNETGIPFVL